MGKLGAVWTKRRTKKRIRRRAGKHELWSGSLDKLLHLANNLKINNKNHLTAKKTTILSTVYTWFIFNFFISVSLGPSTGSVT